MELQPNRSTTTPLNLASASVGSETCSVKQELQELLADFQREVRAWLGTKPKGLVAVEFALSPQDSSLKVAVIVGDESARLSLHDQFVGIEERILKIGAGSSAFPNVDITWLTFTAGEPQHRAFWSNDLELVQKLCSV